MAAKKSAKKATAKKATAAPSHQPAKKTAAKKAAGPTPKPEKKTAPSIDSILHSAYLNYRHRVENGLPGDAHGDWLEAERQLREESTES